jgi:predicted enzyme related to lactoylglutathione lyase
MSSVSELPIYASGKICYIEIPAIDVQRSAGFYHAAFGWQLRTHPDGSVAFDDTVGQVSGMWVTGRKPIGEAGLIVSIMVSDAAASCNAIVAAGGRIVRPVDPNASEITAWFLDPVGNLFGIYQEAALAAVDAAHDVVADG